MPPRRKKETSISFKYIFPSDLRELHVNGAYGGVIPDGNIRMGLYSERRAIPNSERRMVNPDGTLGGAFEQEKKYDVVRIVQANLVFNVDTARSFVSWLKEKIDAYEEFQKKARKESTTKEAKK